MTELRVIDAMAADAAVVRDVIHAAFDARPRLDPASTAPEETTESVAAAILHGGGLLCHVDGTVVGVLLFAPGDAEDGASACFGVRRVSVVPQLQRQGVASALVAAAEQVACRRGYDDVRLRSRAEVPATLTFWRRRGYCEVARDRSHVTLAKALVADVSACSAEQCRQLGERLGRLLAAGDVVILTGELGAGKTTLTQGIGVGLGIQGQVTSPTFVISRIHPPLGDGPALVHVDAYRLGDDAELDDLDLDAYVERSVTVVEWGAGIAEALSSDWLHVSLSRSYGDDSTDEMRSITVTPVGARWVGAGVRSALLGVPAPGRR